MIIAYWAVLPCVHLHILSHFMPSLGSCWTQAGDSLQLHFEPEKRGMNLKPVSLLSRPVYLTSFMRVKSWVAGIALRKNLTVNRITLFLGQKVAQSNLQIQQALNRSTCFEINLTLQYYTLSRPSLSHTLSRWLWYKSSYSTNCLRRKPQRSPSFHRHQRNRQALLSLSGAAIFQPRHALSPPAELI